MKRTEFDWSPIRLVAFDVDGTLYAQRPVRLRMAVSLALHCLARRDLRTLAALRTFRLEREKIGDAETEGFEDLLIAEVAQRHGIEGEAVRCMADEWIDRRPLALLRKARYAHVDRLFQRLSKSGRTIGVLSDYPAKAKLAALQLQADHVVSADAVRVLKPHPRGLQRLMELAEVDSWQTVLIGDRADRDGDAARRAGVACLLRSARQIPGYLTFSRFDDPLFDAIEARPRGSALEDDVVKPQFC